MSKATITVEGFVTRDPELRNANGKDVVSVDIAHTPRKKDADQWVDAGDTIWFQAAFWERDARPVADTIRKGTLVTVTGSPELNQYTKQDGTMAVNVRIKGATIGVIPRESRQQPVSTPNTAPQPQWDTQATNGPQTGAQGSWATAGQIADAEVPF